MCPVHFGYHLDSHCSMNLDYGTCIHCEPGRTYNSYPNFLDSCEPCTSCNPKANLEVEDKCTTSRDTVCRCQQGHYCDKGKVHCRACYPCTICGNEGTKVACTPTNNTICHDDQKQGGGRSHAAVLASVMVFAVCLIFCCLRRNNKCCFGKKLGQNGGLTKMANRSSEVAMEMQPLRGIDLWPHLLDIAKTLGWKDMKQVAERSGMTIATIEFHQLNYPNDTQEQCSSLLRAWVENEGMTTASETLIQTLRRMEKNAKADNIMAIIRSKENTV
ncbi:tumor necrosis factor receptor superfamily member 6 isoform X3 [Salmo salar]|uniref:Tumor necrosis factor receptor superfamily member 6 isoform X3 n=1 Tax=Salmo salar TaxID=8030 RepID=A0A1S3N3R2_SALSA|nr:tumor necrosis factor receptor superfamily member 6-like isoform X3 [Salmo salar]|eukprot:XP_014010123.1 PREDICTED: tumor necrosis factor receptor superfamily member 6-like isoform X2 [Salmo salar]